jgi:hypothetical protein
MSLGSSLNWADMDNLLTEKSFKRLFRAAPAGTEAKKLL